MEEKAKNELLELYREALGNLQAKAVNEEAARAFQQVGEAAHGKLGALEAEAKDREAAVTASAQAPEVTLSSPLRQIEHLLQQEKAGLAALDARRTEYEQQLDREANRPLLIRKRISEAKREQEDASLQLQTLPGEEDAATMQARQWALETRYQALNTEMRMLDQELLTQPIRLDILKLERDKAAGSVASIRARVATLEELVTRKYQEEAGKAKAQAVSTRQGAEGKHQVVVQLAEQNARMSEQIANIASELDGLAAQMSESG